MRLFTLTSYLVKVYIYKFIRFWYLSQAAKTPERTSTTKYGCLRYIYEGCSNMNASGFITFVTYMLRQNGKRFYRGLYFTFNLAPALKKNSVYLSSYSPLNKGHVSILINSMLRTYTSDIDERIILRLTRKSSWNF